MTSKRKTPTILFWHQMQQLASITHSKKSIINLCKGRYPCPSRLQSRPVYTQSGLGKETLIITTELMKNIKHVIKRIPGALGHKVHDIVNMLPNVPRKLSFDNNVYIYDLGHIRPLNYKDLAYVKNSVNAYLQGDSDNIYVAVYLTLFSNIQQIKHGNNDGHTKFLCSGYLINKETGISQHTIGMLRHHKSEIGNLTLDNAVKLRNFCFKYNLDLPTKMRKLFKEGNLE